MPQVDTCRLERDGPILTITIDRPHVLNALNPAAHHALGRAFDAFAADAALRVAILCGTGERAFCVGSDLKEKASEGIEDDHPPSGFGGITKRFDLAKPVIAAVNGMAIGGGLEMVLACDLAVAAEHAVFSLPEPRVGLAAIGGGGLQRLVRQIPMKQAMELILTGRRLTATEALAMGLVNDVVPTARLMARARAMAAAIIEGAPLAIEASKRVALDSLAHPDLATAIAARYEVADRMWASEDAQEGPRAFAERRKPSWRGT